MWVEISGLAGRLASGWFWWREGIEEEAQQSFLRTGRRQGDEDAGLFLDDGGSELDEVQAERVELGAAPLGTLWTGRAERSPDPVGSTM